MDESSETCLEMIQIDLNEIATVNWNKERGEKLRCIRGKHSMQSLVDLIKQKYNYSTTKQYIQMLERPVSPKASKTVSFALLRYICDVVGADVRDLYDSPKISQKKSSIP
ncbi:MAG: hypothetical protein C6Y22_24630 [Hapalosiphonaceae cyanobacterium JJU2]|nr:MAG: hypothetical protein C6Y22_24630 [Hapalosiphonaceae cyanobacterium JJU2]